MIGIIGRYEDDVLCISSNIIKIIEYYKFTPIVLAPEIFKFDKKIIDNLFDKIDGFILPGGETWSKLDEYILNKCISEDKCLLGICMGFQLICYDNYNLLLNDTNKHNSKDKYVHKIKINRNTKLYEIIKKDEIFVNSRHNYHIDRTDLIVSATSLDNYIEAVEYKDKKCILGFQFHPEDLFDDENIKKIFDYFFYMCRKSI